MEKEHCKECGTIYGEKCQCHTTPLSAEVPGYVLICPQCEKEIPANWVQQGGLHMHCFGVEIDVWFVSLPDLPGRGYYEKDISQVAAMLEVAEEPYLISRQKMVAGQFYNLPDFDGF